MSNPKYLVVFIGSILIMSKLEHIIKKTKHAAEKPFHQILIIKII